MCVRTSYAKQPELSDHIYQRSGTGLQQTEAIAAYCGPLQRAEQPHMQPSSPVRSGMTVESWPLYSIRRRECCGCCWLLLLVLRAAPTPSAAATWLWLCAWSMLASSTSSSRPMLSLSTEWPWSSTNEGQMKADISSVAWQQMQQHRKQNLAA